jgi:hypothetical protein
MQAGFLLFRTQVGNSPPDDMQGTHISGPESNSQVVRLRIGCMHGRAYPCTALIKCRKINIDRALA